MLGMLPILFQGLQLGCSLGVWEGTEGWAHPTEAIAPGLQALASDWRSSPAKRSNLDGSRS
jgi:hypothetical protein